MLQRRGRMAVWIAVAAAALAATPAAAREHDGKRQPPPEVPRGLRCRIDPFDQWCVQLGIGGTLGLSGDRLSYGLAAQVGTFPLKHLGTAVDGGFLFETLADDGNPSTSEQLRRYDGGLTLRYYIPLGASVLLSPGYRGGLFWYRDALTGHGTVHGPRVGLSFRLTPHVYLGIQGVYEWVTFRGKTEPDLWLAPLLTVAF